MEASIEKVKDLVRLIRGIQLPSLPHFLALGFTNGNSSTILTQQPTNTSSSEENQQSNKKNSTSLGSSLSDAGNTFTDLRDTLDLHNNPTNPHSSAEKTENISETKNASISRHGPVTNTCPTPCNTHSQNTMCATSNGTLEPEDEYEESRNQNTASEKGCMGDINTNSIRDLRGSVEPPLPTVMPMAEVVQGIE